ncbi:MAG: hypothetical protein AAGL89_04630 [Pseudomonadota bacterium]
MLGFIIAVVAGAATPMIEAPLARPLAQALSDVMPLEDGELRAFAFMIAMIIAGILCAIFGTGSALGLAVGGTLGYFVVRLARWIQRVIEGRNS